MSRRLSTAPLNNFIHTLSHFLHAHPPSLPPYLSGLCVPIVYLKDDITHTIKESGDGIDYLSYTYELTILVHSSNIKALELPIGLLPLHLKWP